MTNTYILKTHILNSKQSLNRVLRMIEDDKINIATEKKVAEIHNHLLQASRFNIEAIIENSE